MKNYYQILNVKPDATDDEIKRNYRVLAKKYHPDVNPGDLVAAARFTDINEAHDVLSDPKRRAEYDAEVKKANAPKPRPEDIIARQRAAAQAAARHAAQAHNAYARPQGSTLDPSVVVQRAAQAQAAAQAQTQAAVQAAVQAQVRNMQAQMTAAKDAAYKQGYDKGYAAAREVGDREVAKLNSTLRQLRMEISNIRSELTSVEADRSDLEQELFKRDCELTQETRRADELEYKLSVASASKSDRPRKFTTADYDGVSLILENTQAQLSDVQAQLEETQNQLKQLEQEKVQSELRNQAQIQLQHDKRQHMQDEIDERDKQIADLNAELDALRAENEQWQQYAKTEDFISESERRLQDWDQKQKADKKLAKTTLYGPLGVLIWATDEEIENAYAKLVKYYNSKRDEVSIEKLQKVHESYAVLSDPVKRAEYNASIGIGDERIREERALIKENEQVEEEYRNQLESKEFWKNFDELTFNAQTGDADAQNKLGEMYYYGDEIEQDLNQAVYWFKEAAKQKHADGMFNLGVCFVNGDGLEKNKTTGLGFIRQAAKLGSELANEYLSDAKLQLE